MATRKKCVFKSVNFDKATNTDNTGVWARSQPSRKAANYGVLFMKNCPDGKTFYCEAGALTNSFAKLLDPTLYSLTGVTKETEVWVYVTYGHLSEITDEEYDETEEEKKEESEEEGVGTDESDEEEPKITTPKITITDLSGTTESAWTTGSSSSLHESLSYSTYNVTRTSFTNDYSSFSSNIQIIKRNLNIGSSDSISTIQQNMLTKFNRFLIAFPDIQLSKSFAHVFFTRPDLNLYDDSNRLITKVSKDPTFYYLDVNCRNLLQSLTSNFNKTHAFNPYLSNMAGSFELKDEVLETVETAQTFTGHKIKVAKHNIDSKTAGSFSISYIDDKDYNIYKLHKAWTDYISKVYRGEFTAREDNIRDRVLDYACSVYYILCGPDGESILFWSKYTGVFPTNTPSAASSWSRGNFVKMPEFTISYDYAWKEDFNPLALAEFNVNANVNSSSGTKYAKTYEPENVGVGKTFVGAPFIETVKNDVTNEYTFKLRFKTP